MNGESKRRKVRLGHPKSGRGQGRLGHGAKHVQIAGLLSSVPPGQAPFQSAVHVGRFPGFETWFETGLNYFGHFGPLRIGAKHVWRFIAGLAIHRIRVLEGRFKCDPGCYESGVPTNVVPYTARQNGRIRISSRSIRRRSGQ
jgi:hypothetical protein